LTDTVPRLERRLGPSRLRPPHRSGRVTARALLDPLVGAQHYQWGYDKTERLGGLAVHDHLELGRKLHRKIARLLAAQDAIDVRDGTMPKVYLVDSVREEAAVSGK
jgi:hypothetical protein